MRRKSSNSDKNTKNAGSSQGLTENAGKDWHYYLSNKAFKQDWEQHKKFYISFFIIGLVLLLSIAYINSHFGG